MLSVLLLAAALQEAPPAAAPAPPRGAPVWLRRPTGEDLARYFPDIAVEAGVGGRAVISCRAMATGELAQCEVVSETPAGFRFGEAALRLAPLFRLAPRMTDGSSVEGITLRLPLAFHVAEPPPPPPQ